jgi:hypothetical protein
MEEENNKQAEARRLLDAIRQKQEDKEAEEIPILQKPVQWLVSEDAAQLQALVEQTRGIKNQVEEKPKELLPDPESIDPISVEQIKVMRKANAALKATPVFKTQHIAQRIYEFIIRAYFEALDFIKPSGRVKRCFLEGHQCLHCGAKFPATPAVPPPEDPSEPGAAH